MALETLKLDDQQRDGLTAWLADPNNLNPHDAFNAMQIAPGKGKYPTRDELALTPLDHLAAKFGYLTDRMKHADELSTAQETLLPFVQKAIGQKMQMQMLRSMAPSPETAARQYGIPLEPSQLPTGPDPRTADAMATYDSGQRLQQLRELGQDIPAGSPDRPTFMQSGEQVGRLMPLRSVPPQSLNEPAPPQEMILRPHQLQQLEDVQTGKGAFENGRFVQASQLKPRPDLVSPDQFQQEILLHHGLGNIDTPQAQALLLAPPTRPIPRTSLDSALGEASKRTAEKVKQRHDVVNAAQQYYLNNGNNLTKALSQYPGIEADEILAADPNAKKPLVNIQNQLPASEEAQKDFMKSSRATYDQLKHAPATLRNIEDAKKLVQSAKGFMGPGGETLLDATKFLNNRLGMSINMEGVKGAEELRSRIFFNIMDNLKKLDAQPSQQQQTIMMESLGKLGTDPNAMTSILDAFGSVIKDKVALHNDEMDSAISRGIKFPYDPKVYLSGKKQKGGDIDAKLDLLLKELQNRK